MRREIVVGVRWLVAQPTLATLAIVVGVMNFGTAAASALLVLFLQDEAGAGTGAYALILTVAAVGALVGNVLAERFAGRVRPDRALPAAVATFAVALIVVGAAPVVVVITAAFALIVIAGAFWNVITVSMRQQLIPNELLGRVNSVYRLVAYGTLPLGALGGGLLARAAGLRAPFIVGGIAIAAAVPALVRSLRPRELPRPTTGAGFRGC
jgi:predicted MFS family arabinose efflux permease